MPLRLLPRKPVRRGQPFARPTAQPYFRPQRRPAPINLRSYYVRTRSGGMVRADKVRSPLSYILYRRLPNGGFLRVTR
ncbi:MAG: hypothetical protein J4224_01730 [Candidatus Diapherotrites archaeon]|uniref:Uncharacterized protein n=1 Tax=Candidatus Iainarchaeum sp. TaxID=3101447 RepID=A0A7J4IWZ3_9ARCH|nr:MAG: hypothetical protein QT03_C0001G1301 [archaeon GW2011_AR10]MBS3059125.1 hypothetical protein [Candidatus Diapherotrites archaeon]HIH08307.1 hypothetical protein [Candidatus Diapherotrites archaeon]